MKFAQRMIKLFALLLFLQVFMSGAATASSYRVLSDLENQVVEFKLANGMKWLLLKKGTMPIFSGIVMAKTASVDEDPDEAGLAHLLEHMAFKGTKDITHNELWDAFLANGATDLNAYTSKDVTAYYASMPSSKLELWLYLNSEMVAHSEMRDFYKERDVVTEEYMTSVETNPGGKLYQALLAATFKKSSLGWPVIGKLDVLTNLKPEQLAAFKNKYYVPSRMVGVIIGDVDIEETKSLIEEYFGPLKGAYTKDKKFSAEDEQNGLQRISVSFDASPEMIMAFHKPTLPQFDDYVFDVISFLLCDGDSSRLRKSLIFEKKLVSSVDCSSSAPSSRHDNLFAIFTGPLKGHSYNEIELAVGEELNRLRTEAVPDKELTKIKNNIIKGVVSELMHNNDLAHSVAFFEQIAGDWRYLTRRLGVYEKIGSQDIMKAAQKYLIEKNETIVELVK